MAERDQCLLEIKAIGERVRHLKASKADKGKIKAEVDKLLLEKKRFETLTGEKWDPNLVEAVNQSSNDTSPLVKNGGSVELSDEENLLLKIKDIGDKIRALKSQKADKSVIDSEVNSLLEAKNEYKERSGQEWKPNLIDAVLKKTGPTNKSSHSSLSGSPSPKKAKEPMTKKDEKPTNVESPKKSSKPETNKKERSNNPVPLAKANGNEATTDMNQIRYALEGSITAAESKCEMIWKVMEDMAQKNYSPDLLEVCPSVAHLRQENEKLKYRTQILRKAIQEEKCRPPRPSTSDADPPPPPAKKAKSSTALELLGDSTTILAILRSSFKSATEAAFPSLAEAPIVLTEAAKPQFGDYQCNSAMAISQLLGKSGEKTNPRAVAEKIVSSVPKTNLIEKLEIAGPGFINIFLNRADIVARVCELLTDGVKPPKVVKKRVVVDYSSPNIAKQMHVGHLRSTIIGESVCRLLEYVGFDVLRLNHVGDWGTQFGMLIAHLQDRFPNYLNETPPLDDLQAFYKESKKRFDSEEAFKKRAYECVVKLQNFDPEFVKAWQMICDVSRCDFERIYKRLDVSIKERGESFYQDRMKAVVKELEDKGVLQEEEGRKLMFVTGRDVPLTVVKSDGGYTYDTSDLAALKQRLNEEGADWVLYVVDMGQALHLETVFQAGIDLGWFDPTANRIEHVGFGLVLGEDRKKFKTRSGDTVQLTELLDEGLKRALDTLKEKEREKELNEDELGIAQEAVAYGCIKYADLSNNRTSDYVFSFDRMLKQTGNTAVYLLYAYTRIRSIGRKANVDRSKVVELANQGSIDISEAAEFKLAKTVLKFGDVVLTCLETLKIHFLCEFLYEMATVFSEFYKDHKVVEQDSKGGIKKVHLSRLALCEATADVMAAAFAILGIRTVEKM